MASQTTPMLRQAVDHALAGEWEKAHLIVQDLDGNRIADWIHGIVHRMEGDLDNARYWYGKCGRELSEKLSTKAELQEIEKELGAQD